MLVVSILGLPGLSVPTGLVDGVPMGIQLDSGRFQEETCLTAGEIIEARYPTTTPIDPRFKSNRTCGSTLYLAAIIGSETRGSRPNARNRIIKRRVRPMGSGSE